MMKDAPNAADETVDLMPTLVDVDAMPTVDLGGPSDPAAAEPSFPFAIADAGPRYERIALHASGGMGSVWRAHDARIGREVALKDLKAEVSRGGDVAARFLREATITGQLEHPGVVPVYELADDPDTGRPFYIMRFIGGRTLNEVAREFHDRRRAGEDDSLGLVSLLTAFVSACNTVAYAHARGVIHRDLKGENIVLGDFGEVIVLDWGLAKRLDADDEPAADGAIDPLADAGRTVMGQVMGTPAYMAPEQAEGRLDRLGPWTDIFGLGAILYEILTGGPPFTGTTTLQALANAIRGEITPPRVHWPGLAADLEATCLKALSKDPADRHDGAALLGREVQGWQDARRRKAEDELRRAGERLRRQQAAVVALTRADVIAGADLVATFRMLVETSARILGVARVSLWRYTDDRRAIRCHALFELDSERHSAGTELAASDYPAYFAALAATDVIAADDAQTDPRTSEFAEGYLKPLGIVGMMEVPVHPDGVLCHEHIGPPRRWLPDEQLFAIAIGNLAAHAISHREGRRTGPIGR